MATWLSNSTSIAFGMYGVLGVGPKATDTEIRTAFSGIEQQSGNSLTDACNEFAFEVLSDPLKRSIYDSVHGFTDPQENGVPPAATMDSLFRKETTRIHARKAEEATAVQMSDICWDSHRYTKKPRCDMDMYTCFGAATAGCVLCVRHGIEACGVDPTVTSDTCGYSLESFAAWGDGKDNKKPTADHAGVLRYLHDLQKPVAVPEDTVPNTGVWAEGAGQTQTVDVLDL